MNNINYNFKKHVELLKRRKKILDQNKSFFKENPTEAIQLSKYGGAVSEQIVWELRFEIISIIQLFLNKQIDGDEFCDRIFELRFKHHAKCDEFLSKLISEEIKDFFPSKESYKINGFLTALYSDCEYFEDNLDEDQLYNSIKYKFLKFQKILNGE